MFNISFGEQNQKGKEISANHSMLCYLFLKCQTDHSNKPNINPKLVGDGVGAG